ncbi:protein ITPRID2 [Microcaecilia unicolor]|uniref:Protein ITPRID2 n=1 Tax=Microcaecilia unicolor TaxID=1415580 RepID=A0A6P7YNE8_9AMPH|nr:protein ITPRID2 [Microcaecilia unicolor]
MEAPADEDWTAGATEKRKAWAKSRDSWQASEAEDLTSEAAPPADELELAADSETGAVPNEKIAIWLKDCRTPLGASLDEQNNPTLKGMLVKNGGSFEDDLSLGAEANHLHQSNAQMDPMCNGILAKDRRLQFHQKGRSMNSTGSGKSSTTVSSVSELLDLYEEDPEEILYNLGFGQDEPDIASKIPSRFFNASSFARGIDIKVFLSAQMQRLEVENPNYALTSRFRQIEVLTTVANAFSSLYSQVSGTPLQRIGSVSSPVSKETPNPSPLPRTPSNTASRLMKTLSKLNLHGNQQAGENSSCTTPSPTEKGNSTNAAGPEDSGTKNEQKLSKLFKKKDSPSLLATVKEEGAGNSPAAVGSRNPSHRTGNGATQFDQDGTMSGENEQNKNISDYQNVLNEKASIVDSSALGQELNVSTDNESESTPIKTPHTSTPEREAYILLPNPSIVNLMIQQKDSFELEEVQSTEGDTPHGPVILALDKLGKDLLRTASQHSDSSGFAEDPSTDINSLQVHESLQAMGSSADSCDSETTVTSVNEDLKTPVAKDAPDFQDFDIDDEFFSPIKMAGGKTPIFSENQAEDLSGILKSGNQPSPFTETKLTSTLKEVKGREANLSTTVGSLLQQESTGESDFETNSEYEVKPYTTHHISKPINSYGSSTGDTQSAFDHSESSPLERVNVVLQRAKMKVCNVSEAAGSRAGHSVLTARDILKQRRDFARSGFPLRRTQSLPSAGLSPVRVVSSVNVRLSSGKATNCSPPSFTYKYTPEEDVERANEEDASAPCKSTVFISPSMKKEGSRSSLNKLPDESIRNRPQSCSAHAPSHRSQSSCSLHSVHSDWQERPLCEHARTWSNHSIPSISGASCGALMSHFGCPYSPRFSGFPQRPCTMNPPSTTEMQLRRVLHDIRNSLQNLSQYPMRGNDFSTGGYSTQRPSILPLYENTFQELQVMRRSLNLFRTQMMDLELSMLRQQTMVYQHLTEEERYEADQLQILRNCVREELRDLEQQLEDRLMALEEQLRTLHLSSPYRPQMLTGMYGSRSTESLAYSSPLNVIEPVNELIREQSYLKSELGLGDIGIEAGAERAESVSSHIASDTSSVCSNPPQRSMRARGSSSEQLVRARTHSAQGKPIYRASVALTPAPPFRAGVAQEERDPECLEDLGKSEAEPKLAQVPQACAADESRKAAENNELQQVIREIKESIVGDIRREIVSGLLAAVSFPSKSSDMKHTTQ